MARRSFWMRTYDRFPRQPTAETTRSRATGAATALTAQGRTLSPVRISGRTIAATFWGKAWCTNLEGYGDYANRIPRGRTYVRAGAVIDLTIDEGKAVALVQGSRRYEVTIKIAPIDEPKWLAVVQGCAGRVASLVELLQGKLPETVMRAVTTPGTGLFPAPREIAFACSCPDWASMCKHVAAVLYGIGARLDAEPALLFRLRRVDASQLIAGAVAETVRGAAVPTERRFSGDLASMFGIEIEAGSSSSSAPRAAPARKRALAGTLSPTTLAKAPTKSPAKAPVAKGAPGAKRAKKPEKPLTWKRSELTLLGVPAATAGRWIRDCWLVPTDEPGLYAETPSFRRAIVRYAPRG